MSGLDLTDLLVVHTALIGQTVFLGLWASLPWWRAWIGRALMVKSFALWLLIAVAVFNYWYEQMRGAYTGEFVVTLLTHVAVMIGIWTQVYALSRERRLATRADDPVTGTAKGSHS